MTATRLALYALRFRDDDTLNHVRSIPRETLSDTNLTVSPGALGAPRRTTVSLQRTSSYGSIDSLERPANETHPTADFGIVPLEGGRIVSDRHPTTNHSIR